MKHTPTRTTTPRPLLGHEYGGSCSCGLTYRTTICRDDREEQIARHRQSVADLERYWAEQHENNLTERRRNAKQRRKGAA